MIDDKRLGDDRNFVVVRRTAEKNCRNRPVCPRIYPPNLPRIYRIYSRIYSVTPPLELDAPREITVHFNQIQCTQTVFLNFKGFTWPHVSVNTLVPAGDIVVPPSVCGV